MKLCHILRGCPWDRPNICQSSRILRITPTHQGVVRQIGAIFHEDTVLDKLVLSNIGTGIIGIIEYRIEYRNVRAYVSNLEYSRHETLVSTRWAEQESDNLSDYHIPQDGTEPTQIKNTAEIDQSTRICT